MKKIKVAINGYGRIGRITSRVLANAEDIELVAINDKYDAESLAHLFKYDTVHRVFPGEVSLSDGRLHFGNQSPLLFSKANSCAFPEVLEASMSCKTFFSAMALMLLL